MVKVALPPQGTVDALVVMEPPPFVTEAEIAKLVMFAEQEAVVPPFSPMQIPGGGRSHGCLHRL
jgi:hypothetical protein